MFVPLENTPVRYAWGSHGAISDLLGVGGVVDEPESNAPLQAELWLGSHHSSPTRIGDPALTGGAQTLREWIGATQQTALGELAGSVHSDADCAQLPYLLKVLAAEKPLSLQVHPTLAQARSGYAAETASGIPLDAPTRNYRDRRHKPELLVGLSDRFTALAGFAQAERVRQLVAEVAQAARNTEAFAPVVRAASRLEASGVLPELLRWVLAGGEEPAAAASAIDDWLAGESSQFPTERENLAQIRAAFPSDASALIVLLMNHITLRRGEAIYVRAGVLHAYLRGIGIELMAASDNVLRGGLTPKHIDVAQLLAVLDAHPTPPPLLAPTVRGNVATYTPNEPDFRLQRACSESLDDVLACPGPGIVLCVAGAVQLLACGSGQVRQLGRGEAVYITPDERQVRVRGRGDVFLATVNVAT